MKHYDYIIAGTGCAGLSLAYYISQSPLREKSILLIDKEPKTENDRTWCFWERGQNPFEPVVYRQWPQVNFYGTNFSAPLDIGEYRYKMIRGIDFYRFVQQALMEAPSVDWVFGDITTLEDLPDGARVTVGETTYTASYVFSSLYNAGQEAKQEGYHYFLQHFKGWEITTPKPFFDTSRATLMDFRIDQKGETRFFYVLPLDNRRALVEFTIFSRELLPVSEYDAGVRAYIQDFLHVPSYTVTHEEFGIIPMFDIPFDPYQGKHILHIGTAGGQTKASTGYTFMRIQQHSQALVDQMVAHAGNPAFLQAKPSRFKLYDSMLLNVMANNRYPIKDIFTRLFRENPPATVLKFLDEATTIREELSIFTTTPYVPFLMALVDVVFHKKKPFY